MSPLIAAAALDDLPELKGAFGKNTAFVLHVDVAAIKNSPVWKAIEGKLPAIGESLKASAAQGLPNVPNLEKLGTMTDLPWDSLGEIMVVVETPPNASPTKMDKLDKDSSFLLLARLARAIDVNELVTHILEAVEKGKPGTREKVEKSRRKVNTAEFFDVPKEVLEGGEVPFPVSAAVQVGREATLLGIGRTEALESFLKRKPAAAPAFKTQRYIPQGAQVWLYAPIPQNATAGFSGANSPAAEMGPMFGAMAEAFKNVREFAAALLFGERGLEVQVIFACADNQAATELNAGLQGLVGFFQMSAQKSSASPSFGKNLKLVVEGAVVRLSTTASLADLDRALAGGGRPSQAAPRRTITTSAVEPAAAPPLEVEFVDFLPDEGESLRWCRFRFKNSESKAIKEARLELRYLDEKGRKLGEWSRRYSDLDTPQLVGANATRVSKCPVFFMPPNTENIAIVIREVVFADGQKWSAPQ